MARKVSDAGILEEPRGSGKWWVRIFHQRHRYKRRAASKGHARELREEICGAIRKGQWPPKPEPRRALFDELLEDYREAKRREGKALMKYIARLLVGEIAQGRAALAARGHFVLALGLSHSLPEPAPCLL